MSSATDIAAQKQLAAEVDMFKQLLQHEQQQHDQQHSQRQQQATLQRQQEQQEQPADPATAAATPAPATAAAPFDLQLDDAMAQEFSAEIARVVHLSHLLPALTMASQKFQLEQAAAAVSFERLSPAAREHTRAAHFLDGLRRGFDFCLLAARTALAQASSTAAAASSRGQSPLSSHSEDSAPVAQRATNTNNQTESATTNTTAPSTAASSPTAAPGLRQEERQAREQQTQEAQTSPSSPALLDDPSVMVLSSPLSAVMNDTITTSDNNIMSNDNCNQNNNSGGVGEASGAMNSYNSFDEMWALNENMMQCIAELSHFSVLAMLQSFIMSRNPRVRRLMQDHAAERRLCEYVRSALAVSRDVESSWFAEGFRTQHMNLLCNSLFESPGASRDVLDCDGLLGLILLHGQHLDAENPGISEWSAFTVRNLTQAVPEAAQRINQLRRSHSARARSSSASSSGSAGAGAHQQVQAQ